MDYEKLVGCELWKEYNVRRKALIEKLNEEQAFCDKLGEAILKKMGVGND